jgi:CIC family chloride channel protein
MTLLSHLAWEQTSRSFWFQSGSTVFDPLPERSRSIERAIKAASAKSTTRCASRGIFNTHGSLAFTSPPQLLYYVVLGLLCGLIGWLYASGFYGIAHRFHRLPLPRWMKPGIGGLLVGLIGLVLPQALGMGYGWVQVSMGPGLLSLPLWMILLLPFAKILTTGLSIGSGGSGGIFGPGMVIGAMVGATVWRISYHVLPGVPATPAPFVIVGMMALFGGIAHAPLAVMLMVAEMTGNLSMLAPAMIAVGISSIIVGNHTIYTSQVSTRADSPAHRLQFSFPLLSTLTVRQAMTPPPLPLSPQQTVVEAEQLLVERTVGGTSVLGAGGNLLGVLTLADIGRVPAASRESCRVEEAMNRDVLVAQPGDTLDVALEQLTSHRIGWMPVVEMEVVTERRHLVGRISAQEIMHTYRETLTKGSRRLRGLVEDTVMLEVEIEPSTRLAGCPLREARLPAESLVISIRRRDESIFPRGSSIIEAGDLVTFLVSLSGEARLRTYLAERVGQTKASVFDQGGKTPEI